jgi:hypothetical protein
MPELPSDLVAALECGELTPEQLRRLIALEAEALGLSFDEAVARARAKTLPSRDVIASDLELLVDLLPVAA